MKTEKLRKLRDGNGFSQEYVAAKLGIGQNTYSKLESGQSPLTIDRAKKLAEIYEIDPEFFFDEDDASIVNYNHGNDYKFIIKPETYMESQKELFESIIKDKDEQIRYLRTELEKTRKQLNEIIVKIASKI